MSIPEGVLAISLAEARDQARLVRAAEAMANKLLGYGQLVLNKTGLIDEAIITAVLDTMQAQSLADAYKTTEERPVRFFILHMNAAELLEMRRESSQIFPDKLAEFVADEQSYIARVRNEIQYPCETEDVYGEAIQINPNLPDKTLLKQIVKSVYNKNKFLRFSLKVRETLKCFGNPSSYSLGFFDDGRYEEQDPHYPMLAPIFNIRFSQLPDDPIKFLENYNKRYALYEEAIGKGDIKRTDIFSESEIAFADQCRALVAFIDGSFYQSSEFPRAHLAIVAPLFPYQVIEQNYGYVFEPWLGFRSNDELMIQLGEVHQEII